MATAEGRLPNFFIVGVPKAGTTSLYHHLAQHPEIFMSPLKETCFFSPEMRVERLAPELQALGQQSAENLREYLDSAPLGPRFGGVVTEWADYLRLFAGASHESSVGEATPGYLWSDTAANRIAACIPDARIIAILRNPVDRAFSQYLQMSNTGTYRLSFQAHIQACLANKKTDEISMVHPFLEYGLYTAQIQRYGDVFPASQIGIWLYEDTKESGFLEEVFTFLDVDPDFKPDISKRHLEQQVLRLPYLKKLLAHFAFAANLRTALPQPVRTMLRQIFYRPRRSIYMAERERSMLIDYYRDDVLKLESMLELDLSGWLDSKRIQ